MSASLKNKQEKIENLMTKLEEESNKNKPIIVEGAKDAQVLRQLGVGGTILTAKTGGKSFLEAEAEIERLGVREVILLLDFDRRGKEGVKRMRQDLERSRIKVDMRFWHGLKALVGREVQCIEGLSSYLETLGQKVG